MNFLYLCIAGMRVHVIKKQTIEDFSADNAGARAGFRLWLALAKVSDWEVPDDILKTYATADLLGNGSNRVVFNIGGNKYRMICKYFFGAKQVHLFVCWIGSHAHYTDVCNARKQYYINIY